MILKELFSTVAFSDVADVLAKEYQLFPEEIDACEVALMEIRSIVPQSEKGNNKLVVTKVIGSSDHETEPYDVIFHDAAEQTVYACDLMKWNKWLACEVSEKSIKKYGPAVFAACCLYEMTYYGYSTKEVQAHINGILSVKEEDDYEPFVISKNNIKEKM